MPPQHCLKRAVVCGLGPMLVGLGTYGLWFLTRWDIFVGLGLATLGCGVIVFLIGIGQLCNYVWTARRSSEQTASRIARNAVLCAFLLLANFPLALLVAAASWEKMMCYDVIVENRSPYVVSKFQILEGAGTIAIGDIVPGDTELRRVSSIHRPLLLCSAVIAVAGDAKPLSVSYSRVGRYTNCILTITPQGTVTIAERAE